MRLVKNIRRNDHVYETFLSSEAELGEKFLLLVQVVGLQYRTSR